MPIYSAPYPGGTTIGEPICPGEQFNFFEHRRSGDYISVRMNEGWVNIWTLRNRSGAPTGVCFAKIVRVEKTQRPTPVVVDSAGGAAGSDPSGSSSAGPSGSSSYSAQRTPAGSRKRASPYE